jgi:DNA-binding IclR family transcriptional regulator
MCPDMVGTTEKSVRILEHVREAGGATLADLDAAFEDSRGTIHAHVSTLQELGFLVRDDSTYRIGLATLRFGGQARSRYRPYIYGRSEIDRLAEEHGHLVQIAFREGDECVYVYQAGRQNTTLPEPRVGTTVDLHSSAAGKAILSAQPEEAIESIVSEHDLPLHTEVTTTDPEALRDELAEVAETKTAFDFGEQFPNVDCVSTPVVFEEDLVGALSLSTRADAVNRDRLTGPLADAVYRAGREIEMESTFESWLGEDAE